MSILNDVISTLKKSPKARFLGTRQELVRYDDLDAQYVSRAIVQNVDVIAAPINGLYEPSELQEFLECIAPRKIEHGRIYACYISVDNPPLLCLGGIEYREKVGQRIDTRTISFTEEIPAVEGLPHKNSSSSKRVDFDREIRLRVAPNTALAADIVGSVPPFNYRPFAIPMPLIKEHSEGLKPKIASSA